MLIIFADYNKFKMKKNKKIKQFIWTSFVLVISFTFLDGYETRINHAQKNKKKQPMISSIKAQISGSGPH